MVETGHERWDELEAKGFAPPYVLEFACMTCRHWLGGTSCRAFPNKDIPADVLYGMNNHSEPLEGDDGIRYARLETIPHPDA